MIGDRSRGTPRRSRRRLLLFFPLLLLPLLFLALAPGGGSVWPWLGAPGASPAKSSVPSASAVQSGETPGIPQVFPTPTSSGSEIVSTPTPTSTRTPAPSAAGGGTGLARTGSAGFTITGSVGNLMPGVSRPIQLTLINPNDMPIYVTALTVKVSADSTPPGCSSAANLQITQSNISGADPIVIAANGSVTLTSASHAPQIMLLNLPGVNQDVCKGKSFALTYSGSAHS